MQCSTSFFHNGFYKSFPLSLYTQSHPISFILFILGRWLHFLFGQENWDHIKQAPSTFLISHYIYKISLDIFNPLLVLFDIWVGKTGLLFAKVHPLILISFSTISLGIFSQLFLSYNFSILFTTNLFPYTWSPCPFTLKMTFLDHQTSWNSSLLLNLTHIHTVLTVYNTASSATNLLKSWVNSKHQIQLLFSPFIFLYISATCCFPYFLEYSVFLIPMKHASGWSSLIHFPNYFP